jgi:hypothetical protein
MWIIALVFIFLTNFSTILSWGVFYINVPYAEEVLMVKDILLVGCAIYASLLIYSRWKHLKTGFKKILFWILVAILANLISLVTSPASLGGKIFNLRRNLMFILVFLVFATLPMPRLWFRKYCNVSKIVTVVLLLFGFFEYFQNDYFWDNVIEIPKYWKTIGFDLFGTESISSSGRFYTWDLYNLFGKEVRRMVSLYFEPTTFAAYLVSVICLSLSNRSWAYSLFVFIAGILTMSKFFLLASILAFVLISCPQILRLVSPNRMAIGLFTISYALVGLDWSSGAISHLKGFVSAADSFIEGNWLGHGLGVAGNYTAINVDAIGVGEESGLGNLAAQIGLGIIPYLVLFTLIYQSLENRTGSPNLQIFSVVAKVSLLAWIFSFYLSASALGLSGNAMIFFLVGCSYMEINDPLSFREQ